MMYLYKYLIAVFILIISILLYVSERPLGFPYKFYVVSSDSMSQALNKGDLVIAKQSKEFSIGDIITFKSPIDQNNSITHRIVRENFEQELFFTTKGDNNSVEDPWQITPDIISGKLSISIPFIGYPVLFLKSSVIYMYILGGILVLVSFVEVNLLSSEVAYAWERKNSFRLYRNLNRFINKAGKIFEKFRQGKIENAGF